MIEFINKKCNRIYSENVTKIFTNTKKNSVT